MSLRLTNSYNFTFGRINTNPLGSSALLQPINTGHFKPAQLSNSTIFAPNRPSVDGRSEKKHDIFSLGKSHNAPIEL